MNLPDAPAPGETELEWERWSLKEDSRGFARLLLVMLLVLLVGVVLVVSLPPAAAIALGLALVTALLPYLLPRRFRVGPDGLSIRHGFYNTHRAWSGIEGIQPVKGGYLLYLCQATSLKPARLSLLSQDPTKLLLPRPLEPGKAAALAKLLQNHINLETV
jgi:hypothetical protein